MEQEVQRLTDDDHRVRNDPYPSLRNRIRVHKRAAREYDRRLHLAAQIFGDDESSTLSEPIDSPESPESPELLGSPESFVLSSS